MSHKVAGIHRIGGCGDAWEGLCPAVGRLSSEIKMMNVIWNHFETF